MRSSSFSKELLIGIILASLLCADGRAENGGFFVKRINPDAGHVSLGVEKEVIFQTYPKEEQRTYRKNGSQEWITFNMRGGTDDEVDGFVTFYVKNNILKGWALNDRREIVSEYMGEFSSRAFKEQYTAIYEAIRYVLMKIPKADFLALTDRSHPVIFTEYHSEGPGGYANSSDILSMEEDPPTFTNGFYMVKLNAGMSKKGSVREIAGVVAHELAHRVLGHSVTGQYSSANERQANALVVQWGFKEELKKAILKFGN